MRMIALAKIRERTISYKGKDIVVKFSVDRCTHVAACLRGAPAVFDTARRPWIDADAEPADKVAEVVESCPTGALHYRRTDGGLPESPPDENTVILVPDGPLYVFGDLDIVGSDGELLLEETRIALCRCGESDHKPFCDGIHVYADFEDEGRIGDTRRSGDEIGSGKLCIKLQQNGPLLLSGPFVIQDVDENIAFRGTKAALCRCGASKKMPFCDGNHTRIEFNTEDH